MLLSACTLFNVGAALNVGATVNEGTALNKETTLNKETAAGDGASKSTADGGLDPDNLPAEMSQSLEQLLSDPEGSAPDRNETRCVNRRIAVQTEILDAEHLVFRGRGNKAWLNRLTPGCVGLRPDMILVMGGQGGNLCEFDRVHGLTRVGAGGIPTGTCLLGKFEPITPQHADSLKDSFQRRGKEIAAARRDERIAKRKARRQARKDRRAARKIARAAKDPA